MKLSHIINEAKYPADIDGITMKFLYLGINNAAKKILDNIKKRTGSSANPISLQVIEGIGLVNKQLQNFRQTHHLSVVCLRDTDLRKEIIGEASRYY